MPTSYRLRACLWELTLRCNMHCMHCGSAAGRARSRELALEECFPIVDDLVRLGCEHLGFIGGEIFLYRGWERLARHASDRGMLVNIMTNAYHLREAEVAQIQHARLRNVGVSVDGMEEIHNHIRGRRDSFARVTEAFGLLDKAGIPTGAVTSLMRVNAGELEALYEHLLSCHVQLWQLQLVNAMGNMAGREDQLFDSKCLPWLIDFIQDKNSEREMAVVAADSIGYYHADSEASIRGRGGPICVWEGCQAGLSSLFIDSRGCVKGCGALCDDAFIEGNVRERSLQDIWSDESRFAYNRALAVEDLSGACHACDVAEVCRGGCRASNFFTTGSPTVNGYCAHSAPPFARSEHIGWLAEPSVPR